MPDFSVSDSYPRFQIFMFFNSFELSPGAFVYSATKLTFISERLTSATSFLHYRIRLCFSHRFLVHTPSRSLTGPSGYTYSNPKDRGFLRNPGISKKHSNILTVFTITFIILNIFTPDFVLAVRQTVGYHFITFRHLVLLTGPPGYTYSNQNSNISVFFKSHAVVRRNFLGAFSCGVTSALLLL